MVKKGKVRKCTERPRYLMPCNHRRNFNVAIMLIKVTTNIDIIN